MKIISERGIESDQSLASLLTLCRLENRINRKALAKISEVFVENFIHSYKQAPDELILDFDATDDSVYGKQEMRFFHGLLRSLLFSAIVCILRLSTAGCISSPVKY
jgi:hypothetical protein